MTHYLKLTIQLLVLLIIFVFGISLVFSNYETLIYPLTFKLKLFAWQTRTRPFEVFWLIIISFLCGVLATMVISFFSVIKLRSMLSRSKREIADLRRSLKSVQQSVQPTVADVKPEPKTAAEETEAESGDETFSP